MKKTALLLMALIVALGSLGTAPQKSFKNGVYFGESRDKYTSEPFFGQVKVTIAKGEIAEVAYKIVDKEKKVDFDKDYEKYYKGNDEYIKQCRNDLAGVKKYPRMLVKVKDIDKVDAISGATWSYNIFKAALADALKKAVK